MRMAEKNNQTFNIHVARTIRRSTQTAIHLSIQPSIDRQLAGSSFFHSEFVRMHLLESDFMSVFPVWHTAAGKKNFKADTKIPPVK